MKKRNKTIRKPIIMLSIALLLIFFVNNGLSAVFGTIDSLMNQISARTIIIDVHVPVYEHKKEELNKYFENSSDKIEGIYEGNDINIRNLREEYNIYAIDAFLPEVMKEYTQESEPSDGEILIPKYISVDGDSNPEKTMEPIDGEQFIGKTLTFQVSRRNMESYAYIDTKDYTFTVAGVFDNVQSGDSGVAYINQKSMREIEDYAYYYPEEYINDEYYKMYMDYKYIRITVKDSEYTSKMLDEIKEILSSPLEGDDHLEGYDHLSMESMSNVYVSGMIEEGVYLFLNGIMLIGNFIAVYLILCSIMNILAYIKECMEMRKREFGILKAIGYRNGRISLILLKETLLEICIPLGITYGIGGAVFFTINRYIHNNFSVFWQRIEFNMEPGISMLIILIAVLVPVAGYVTGYIKLSRLEPMEALR